MAAAKNKFKHPLEWNDEERMYFLLAPFPPGNEPVFSDSKLSFWRTLIISSSREQGECVFTKRQLCERFQWREMQPNCLNDVIKAMERIGEVAKLSSYGDAGSGWIGWSVSVVASPLTWTWKKYFAGDNSVQDSEEEYVIVSYAKELSEAVFAAHLKEMTHATTDCLCMHSEFVEKCNDVLNNSSSLQTCKAIELELIKERLAIKGIGKEEAVIKLAASRNLSVTSLSETDIGIISIKNTLTKLQARIFEKGRNRDRWKQKCVALVASKQKSRALHYLRLSKSIEAQMIKLEKHSENLQEVLNQIEMAETNAEVLKAYESGCSALKRVQDEHGLTLERAENVMDEVEQLMEDSNAMSNVLSEAGLQEDYSVSDDELLKELDVLVNQSTTEADFRKSALVKDLESLSLNDHDSEDTSSSELKDKKQTKAKEETKAKHKPVVLMS